MIYILATVLFFLLIIMFFIIGKFLVTKSLFELKIKSFEKTISEMSLNLEIQAQKVKLTNDLKYNLKNSNSILSNKIAAMNYEIFEEMFKKKTLD